MDGKFTCSNCQLQETEEFDPFTMSGQNPALVLYKFIRKGSVDYESWDNLFPCMQFCEEEATRIEQAYSFYFNELEEGVPPIVYYRDMRKKRIKSRIRGFKKWEGKYNKTFKWLNG